MNKQEAIERIKKLSEYPATYPCAIVRTPNVIEVIKSINEPQKVKVPQFVAEWIETAKKEKRTLHYSMQDIDDACYYHKGDDPLYRWMFVCDDSSEHQEMFARAWLDGYEVEEEPKWVVKRKDNGKYVESLALGKGIGFIAETTALAKEDGYKFNAIERADAVAVLINGEVEKV